MRHFSSFVNEDRSGPEIAVSGAQAAFPGT
jgi:hypothetical protein